MSSSWTNRLFALGLGMMVATPVAAEKFECPEGLGYEFAYANPDFGAEPSDGWDASIKRADGASAAGVPTLSVRKRAMRCRYQLPNGASVLVTMSFPEGAECVIHQDDYFEAPYFGCE